MKQYEIKITNSKNHTSDNSFVIGCFNCNFKGNVVFPGIIRDLF